MKKTVEAFRLFFGPVLGMFLFPLIFGVPFILAIKVLSEIWKWLF
ncbi:hypothetical protein [Vagococcus penaei]|nr:hypothetical protein [Vagococcus penaei]